MNCGSRWTILSNGSNGERSKILITLFWWCMLSHEGCITFNWKMISSPHQGILRRWRNLPWKRKPWTLIGFYWTFANWDLLVEPSLTLKFQSIFCDVIIYLIIFAGKMFKSTDLPYIIQFAVMFHNDKPVDWLLDPIIETRYCPHDTVRVTRYSLNFMRTSSIFFFVRWMFPVCRRNVIRSNYSSGSTSNRRFSNMWAPLHHLRAKFRNWRYWLWLWRWKHFETSSHSRVLNWILG